MASFLHRENKQSGIWFEPFPLCKALPPRGPHSQAEAGRGHKLQQLETPGCLGWWAARVLSRGQASKPGAGALCRREGERKLSSSPWGEVSPPPSARNREPLCSPPRPRKSVPGNRDLG